MTVTVINVPPQVNTMVKDAEEGSGKVKVIVRVRPPNDLEASAQNKNVVAVMNENVLVFDPKDASSPLGHGRRRRHRDIRKRRQKDMKFAFDHVFDCNSSNEEVFQDSTKSLLDGLLGGYNCSVFAYGATGAGKTHTMLGSPTQPGVIYHTMIHLYRYIADMSHEKTFDIAVSYLEVYNEQIRDLLLPRNILPIREDPACGVVVPGLSLHKPKNAEELLYMLQFGNKNRTQHPTDANAESSRSHAVFQVFVRQKDRTANISTEVRVAKMCLVDLAGSERATVTKNRGARLREGANINRSLLALGNVINSLADNKSKGHVPYRDSKLTRLLKDSLGGNCRTVMIAAVSPSHLSYEDTYNTLKYADRAKNISLNVKKNVLNVDFHVSRYGKIVEELRKEIAELKGKLQQCEGPTAIQSIPPELNSVREKLKAVFNARCALRDQQLQQETSLRDIQWKLHCKHLCLHRASLLSNAQPEMVHKIQGAVQGLQKKLNGQEAQRLSLSQQLQDNSNSIRSLQSHAAGFTHSNSFVSQMLELTVQKQWRNVQLNDSRHYIHHLRRLARAQAREAVTSNTLISTLLRVVQRQHMELLTRPGLLAPEVAADYQTVCQLVGQWGVTWADPEGQNQGQGDGDVPFHINNIIDIPLLADSGVLFDTVTASGKSPCASNPRTDVTNPVLTCPGRVINGQVDFPATPSAPSHPPPALPSQPLTSSVPLHHTSSSINLTTACVSQDHSSPGLLGYQPVPAPQTNNTYSTLTDCRDFPSHCPDTDADVGSANTVTVYAGQTPNPKKVPLSSETRQSQDRAPAWSPTSPPVPAMPNSTTQPAYTSQQGCITQPTDCFSSSHPPVSSSSDPHPPCVPPWSAASQSHPVSTYVSHSQPLPSQPLARPIHLSAVSPSGCGGRVIVPVSGNTTPHRLNETFSLEDCSDCGPSTTISTNTHPADSTVVLSKTNILSVPVIDASLPCPRDPPAVRNGGERSSVLQSVPLAVSTGNVQQCDNSRGLRPVQSNGVHEAVSVPPHHPVITGCRTGDKENARSGSQYSPQAKRAINFDQGPASTPTVMSYADAVRTPTPPRKALQELNHNSPQVLARTLPTALNQTPKHKRGSSMYHAGPQTYENMQRLKQLGMPSLVESLIAGNKTERPQSEASRPSYMQSTKAHAQRVRHQVFRDDNFYPRRVQHKTLAHSRSKSVSNLTKSGWKI